MEPVTKSTFDQLVGDMKWSFKPVDENEDISEQVDAVISMFDKGYGNAFLPGDREAQATFMRLPNWVRRGIILAAMANGCA